MKGFHEYLELYQYFAQGEPRLGREEYDAADREYRALAARHPKLDSDEKARLHALKALLYRDKP